MEKVKAVTLPRHVGKYLRYFLAEESPTKTRDETPRTWIAQITMVVPEHHIVVLKKITGAGDEDQDEEFTRHYKKTDMVEIYDEDEAILLAFRDEPDEPTET